MDAIIKNFVNTEKERWQKAIRKSMRTVANKVKMDFVTQGQACMDAYYREYDPLKYDRTFNLQNNAVYPYERARKGEVFVGVAFSSLNMDPYKVSENSELDGYDVANLVVSNFMEGIHGHPSIRVGRYVDETMTHFETSYKFWELDKYFQDNFIKYMK